MLSLPGPEWTRYGPEWTRYGKMRVARWLDPDLARRVYLELVRLERVSKAIDTAPLRGPASPSRT